MMADDAMAAIMLPSQAQPLTQRVMFRAAAVLTWLASSSCHAQHDLLADFVRSNPCRCQ